MDEILTVNYRPSIFRRLLSAFVPMLLVAVAYVDPGKWAAAVEGGARFGCDIGILMLVFNFAAILCQYISARITVVTGKDLAQICSEDYDKVTCIFLGVQAELSVIVLDLTMILGTAHGFHLIFGADLLTCVFLTAVDAVLFPVFSTFLEEGKAKFLCICMASFTLISYFFGVLSSQSGIPFSMGGMLTKLSGESAAALMSLLGASIMPHNFYLHSSIIKQEHGGTSVSKEALCHDHLFAILSIFSGIFLVNYMLVNSAANVFYTADLLLLTFQDALSLMDQVCRNTVLPFVLILVLVFSNHITALTWNLGRQAVLHNFFRVDIPGWFHHAIIRVIAIVPALYCVFTSGAEGVYQLLIFTQIVIALLLPSSVIPLFRVATSKSIMGEHKISQFVEFLVLITFIGMLGLEIVFVIEMIFGSSDWASNLRWNMGSGMSVPYVVLLVIASVSLCLMLWLAATPLTSASSRLDIQECNWDIQASMPESYAVRNQNDDFNETQFHVDESSQKREPALASDGSHLDMLSSNPALNLPEELLDSDSGPHLTTIEENCSDIKYSSPSVCLSRDSATEVEIVQGSTDSKKFSDDETVDAATLTTVPSELVVNTLSVVGDSQTEKDDEGDTWEPEESSKSVSLSSPSVTSEGPGSYRSLSGKGDDVGSGAGSLSRLAGLGRRERLQLALVLDEFWGQLFNFHGQATKEAKIRKLDALLGADLKMDPNPACASPKLDNSKKEFTGTIPSVSGRGSDSVINSSLYISPREQSGPSNVESYYGIHRDLSSFWSNNTQLLDTCMQNSNRNAMDPGERRYSSLRLPPSADVSEDQPATIHGYQLAYLSRIAKERSSGSLTGQMESLAPKSPSIVSSNYRDPFATASAQKPRNGLSAKAPPGFPSLAVPRNSSLQPERPFYDISSTGPAKNEGSTVNTKKYHSLPDISGLSLPHRNSLPSDRGAPWDSPMVYRPSTGRTMYEASLYPNGLFKAGLSTSSAAGTPLIFDEFSSSKVCRDAFSLQFSSSSDTGSLWSRQPCEQFGMADKARSIVGEGVGSMQNSITQVTASAVDFEAKLLQSFRICIQKLLKLEGSGWLFRQNDGADEDLIDRVAERERFFYEAETREMNMMDHTGESNFSVDRKTGSKQKNEEMATSVPHCGEDCVWRVDLIISFGVWCIHRVLELSLMERRPDLWGKYTYVLNRLQGIIDLAFFKPRSPMTACFCLQIPVTHHQRSSPPISHGSLPPPAKQARGKCTTAAMLLDIVKDVEIAISCRKGRTGTAAGDVAFPKGKENLGPALKRYKRRLANKPAGTPEGGPGSSKVSLSAPYNS